MNEHEWAPGSSRCLRCNVTRELAEEVAVCIRAFPMAALTAEAQKEQHTFEKAMKASAHPGTARHCLHCATLVIPAVEGHQPWCTRTLDFRITELETEMHDRYDERIRILELEVSLLRLRK